MVEESNILIWVLQGIWVMALFSAAGLMIMAAYHVSIGVYFIGFIAGIFDYVMLRRVLNYEKEEVVTDEHNREVVDEKEERLGSAA